MAGKNRKSARDKAQREFVSEAEELLERMRDDLSTLAEAQNAGRSEERRVGKECPQLCRSRWSPYH